MVLDGVLQGECAFFMNSDGPDQHVPPQHLFSVPNASDIVTVTKVYHISLNNIRWFICLFDLIIYVPVNNISVSSGRVFLD